MNSLLENHPNVNSEVITRMLSLGYALVSQESKSLSLPDFPLDNISHLVSILVSRVFYKGYFLFSIYKSLFDNYSFFFEKFSILYIFQEKFPGSPPEHLIRRLYPYKSFMETENGKNVEELLSSFDLVPSNAKVRFLTFLKDLYEFIWRPPSELTSY